MVNSARPFQLRKLGFVTATNIWWQGPAQDRGCSGLCKDCGED